MEYVSSRRSIEFRPVARQKESAAAGLRPITICSINLLVTGRCSAFAVAFALLGLSGCASGRAGVGNHGDIVFLAFTALLLFGGFIFLRSFVFADFGSGLGPSTG